MATLFSRFKNPLLDSRHGHGYQKIVLYYRDRRERKLLLWPAYVNRKLDPNERFVRLFAQYN